MLVYLVAILESLAYLAAVPVCAAFCVSSEGGLRAGAGLSAFRGRSAARRARQNMFKARRARKKTRGAPRRALELLRRLRIRRIRLRGSVGLGDAAATALACGALSALGTALRGRTESLEVDIAPDFGAHAQLELRGMICASAGQIMLAATKGGFDKLYGRIAHGKAPD